ncbi:MULTISPECIES: PACE efflux transporter [Paracoccus]|nr:MULTISPECIES: PACE efflux transporter [Paracoccus]MBT0780411.1 PACE efflux transporter [Paracoccus sp. pheM1]MCJ1901583.1 PACE efflux transporter [Paracoccus versutus]MDF3905137.1 PACE efflux transporter [Paracoccus sp. AS002]WGR58053.1 PACE efflux transporter [Paracoccus versutus]
MTMRSFPDRVRHALMFETIGLAIITPATAWLYDKPLLDMGVVGVGAATLATVWTFVFNLGFDHAMRWLHGHTRKALHHRLLHTLLFEGGLLVMLLPPMAWYLGMTLWQTLLLDLFIVAFYLVYNFVFNIAYDRIFPLPDMPRGQPA